MLPEGGGGARHHRDRARKASIRRFGRGGSPALKGGFVAGYACYGDRSLTEGVYDLYWIVVDPGMNGQGVGRALVDRTEEILISLKARMIVAETSGLPAFEAARGFYLKCGFLEEARIRDFYKPGDDVVCYVKRLTQKAK